jgi:hypothetical protein
VGQLVRLIYKFPWMTYSGLALETRTSAEYQYVEGQLRRSKKLLSIRRLNKDHSHDLKALFKAASITASVRQIGLGKAALLRRRGPREPVFTGLACDADHVAGRDWSGGSANVRSSSNLCESGEYVQCIRIDRRPSTRLR